MRSWIWLIPSRVRRFCWPPSSVPMICGKPSRGSAGSSAAALSRAEVVGRLTDGSPRVAVAHFARFERSFLEELPVEWLCTHEIACRLLPGLPRRGLRALSGYFGHVMEEEKRAPGHVSATVAVWAALVEGLRKSAGVTTLDEILAATVSEVGQASS